MDSLGKLLLGLGLVLLATGIAVLVLLRYGVHKLPGNIVIHRGSVPIISRSGPATRGGPRWRTT